MLIVCFRHFGRRERFKTPRRESALSIAAPCKTGRTDSKSVSVSASPPVGGGAFLLDCGDDGKRRVSVRKRRSSEEVRWLLAEFESSGLGQNEFCRKQGLALRTLRRQLKKRHSGKCETIHSSRLVRVELDRRNRELKTEESSALCIGSSAERNGRKIVVWPDFDSSTLERVVGYPASKLHGWRRRPAWSVSFGLPRRRA
jgi:hypothetical protein